MGWVSRPIGFSFVLFVRLLVFIVLMFYRPWKGFVMSVGLDLSGPLSDRQLKYFHDCLEKDPSSGPVTQLDVDVASFAYLFYDWYDKLLKDDTLPSWDEVVPKRNPWLKAVKKTRVRRGLLFAAVMAPSLEVAHFKALPVLLDFYDEELDGFMDLESYLSPLELFDSVLWEYGDHGHEEVWLAVPKDDTP